MKTRTRVALGAAVLGLAWLGLTAGPLGAQMAPEAPATTPTHEQMHRMMDLMHGEGTSQRMHEAMGGEAEQMVDQCLAMMSMMQQMMGTGGMMGPGEMGGMMAPSMMEDGHHSSTRDGETMWDMMDP